MVGVSDKKNIAFIALIAGALLISLAPIFVRLSELGPNATGFYRVLFAIPVLYLLLKLERWQDRENPSTEMHARDLLHLLLPGLFFAGDLGFWHWSIRYTTVANSTLIVNFAPVFVTLAAAVLFHERFRQLFYLALVISSLGLTILMGSSALLGDSYLKGDFFGLLAALFYAGYLVSVGRLRKRFSTIVIMFWASLSSTVVLLMVCLLAGDRLIPATANGWLILIALAWISHIGGQGLIMYALAYLSTAFSSVSLLVQPVSAALLAWLLFSEKLTSMQIIGGVMVVFGIYLARHANFSSNTGNK